MASRSVVSQPLQKRPCSDTGAVEKRNLNCDIAILLRLSRLSYIGLATACLQLWKDKALLLVTAEDGLNAYRYPAVKLACQAGRSRGAHSFAIDEQRSMVCVAVKKRLLLYRHSGNEFMELKDFSLPDSATTLQWLGDNICVGFKRE